MDKVVLTPDQLYTIFQEAFVLYRGIVIIKQPKLLTETTPTIIQVVDMDETLIREFEVNMDGTIEEL